MIALLVTILVSIAGRQFGFYLRGLDAYSGYCMAAASFLALAGTFVRGDHIRVTLIISRFSGTPRRGFEIFCLVLAILASGAFAFYSVKLRSEEHTSELQSLMRISYAVFRLQQKTTHIK